MLSTELLAARAVLGTPHKLLQLFLQSQRGRYTAHWFAVNLEGGTTYRIMIEGRLSDRGALERPELWGVAHDFAARAVLGTPHKLPLFFKPTETGIYTIGVRSQGAQNHNARSSGTYTVSVAVATDETTG